MHIETLALKDFRNYREEEIVFHEKTNIIIGRNAQGKTNLIEAIYFLSLAKSFRTRKEYEMIRLGSEAFSVRGGFLKGSGPFSVEIVQYKGGAKQRKYFINGMEKTSVFDLLGGVYTVVFSPEDLRIIKGDPETRRRFLDRELILLRPMYYYKVKKYRGILRNRNALLKEPAPSSELLDVYDEQLSEAGGALMKERAEYVERLTAAAAKNGGKITGEGEVLKIAYRANVPAGASARALEKGTMEGGTMEGSAGGLAGSGAFLEALKRNRERDLASRSTEIGPHRDDLAITVNDRDLRIYGSQGQQRTAALALRLAEQELIRTETGEDAVLLLDDVMSELDAERQERLIRGFEGNQIFITAADISEKALASLPAGKVLRIEEGKVVF